MRREARRSRGQAVPEFAMVVPLILLLAIGTLDMGRVLFAMDTSANAAREAARFAIVNSGSVGFLAAAPVSDIKDRAREAALGVPADMTVTVCYSLANPPVTIAASACTADMNADRQSYVRGTPVTVVIRSQIDLITPSLLGMSGFTVEGSATMMIHN
jgi:Flp pilus assembly protein TadG